MPVAPSGAAQLAYDVEGAGPAVLLLHAGVTDRRSWGRLRDAIGGRQRTIAYDRRGFGETTYEPEEHSQVDDALAVLDAAGADRAVFVGASNGGSRALDVALEAPDRVAALVLIAPGVRGAPDEPKERFAPAVQALWDEYEAAEESDDLDRLNEVEAHAWLDGWSAPRGRVQGPPRSLFLAMNAIALRAADPGPERPLPSAWDRLHQIEVPALVLCGDLDDVCLPASEHVAASVPDARFELLLGTGHLPHLEGHARGLDAVTGFLADVAARR